MSWMDEYNKAMGRSTASASANTSNWMQEYRQTMAEYEEEKKKKKEAERLRKKIAEESKVKKESLTNEEEDDSLLDFFQAGGLDDIDLGSRFKDGWQFGDLAKTAGDTLLGVGKTILGTAGDAGLEVVKGAGGMLEGITDLASYGVATAADLAGKDKFADQLRKGAQRNLIDEWTKGADNYLEQFSVLGRTSDAVAQGIGQVGTILLTGGIGQAAGMGTAGVTALTTGSMGLSGMGSGMGEAYRNGATDEEAVLYGSIAGAADALSELMFGGLGKAVKATGLSVGLSSADDILAKKVSGMFSSQLAKNLSSFGIKAAAEGFEEVVAGTAQALGKKLTYMSEEDFGSILKDENLLEQFVVGAVTSGIAQAPSLHTSVKSGTDFITGQTANEEAVVKKEVEKRIAELEADGKKLTAKEKSAIEAQVEKDLDKGYISTDTIEEVLGGETYQRYKQTIDSENALKEKQKALQEKFDTLNKMKQGEMTGEQIDRRADLKEELAKVNESVLSAENHSAKNLLKERLGKEVSEMVRSDRLIESYNEVERRKQAFEADLTKYDTKQRAVIEKAVKSGILNNTNRTHEFVDMVAKISADKGVLFDFTNNQKLKESGFAIDGKIVNGYVTKDGITINIQSKKSLNSLVGHEITHVLEGTELYTELQSTLIEYAKTKGDYQGRYDSLTKLYEGVEGADINAELTADLVGDYLFTDENFINSLSVNHRNVFQKIYDEVKYLLKVATAGSKEARDLEKVKRAFEKAYQESTKVESDSDADTKYSLSDSEGRQLSNEQSEYFKDSVVRDENGNLKVMYHGTSKGGFNMFDTYGSNYGLFGTGSYFTDNKDIAESYTNKGKGSNKQVYETYLNIKNPMDMDAQADPAQWQKAFPDADFPESGTNEQFYRAVEEFYADQWMPKWEVAEEIQAGIESGMGYDGLTHIGGGRVNADGVRHRVYIAFQPEQIKNVDNVKPTDSADIRYSLSEDNAPINKITDSGLTMTYVRIPNQNTQYYGSTYGQNLEPAGEYMSMDTMQGKYKIDGYEYGTIQFKKPLVLEHINTSDTGWKKTVSDMYNGLTGKKLTKALIKDGYDAIVTYDDYGYSEIVNLNGKKLNDPGTRFSLSENASYAEIEEERQKLHQREMLLEERKRKATNDPELLQAMDDYSNLFTEIRPLLSKKRQGTATQAEIDRIEEIKILREDGLKRVADLQESLGLNAISEEEREIRETKEALRLASDAAWAREGAEKENKAIEKAGVPAPEYFRKKALKAFKTTTNFNEAGYLLPDGKLLNFSGGERNHRYRDHREIGEIYEATNGVAALNRFLNDGNIRIMAESPGIDIASEVEPTAEQYAAIRKFIRSNGMKDGQFFVDFSDNEGRRAGNYSYTGRVNTDRIINDIKYFYANGELRPQSEIGRFLSLSDPDAEHPINGSYNVYGKDVALENAPVAENATTEDAPVAVSEKETTTPATVSKEEMVEDLFPDGVAPEVELENLYQQAEALGYRMREAFNEGDTDALEQASTEYADAMERIEALEREINQNESSRMDSIAQSEEPPEMDAPFYSEPDAPVMPDDPFEDRDYGEVGKRNVNAYMYENPEVKPFFQMEANAMLGDLGNSIRGERLFNDQVYYDSGGEKGWMGTKRMTTDDIAYLLDSGYTYADIEKGLNAIIEDNGKENNAVSKRIEFALNDRLLKGYTNIYGDQIPPDQDYINLLNEKQINEYSQEAFDAFMANADQYAPEEIGPVAQDFSATKNITSAGQQTFLPAGKPRPNIGSDDIAPTYDVTGKKGVPDGQQAFMPDAGVEPKLTRKQLHQNIVDRVKASFQAKGFDFDNVLKKAKDLSTFATVDNTPQRVMEKALGYKQGQVLSELTVDQVAKNETEGIKWLNSFTDRKKGLLAQISKEYNIKPGSKKSAAAQMYAEGFYVGENDEIIAYGDRELAMDFPNVKVQQQIKGLARDPRIRQIYDETLAAINESRTRNAYPEIPRLDNYFLHFRAMEDTFSRLGLPFNPNDIRAKDLPTDLNGVTADLKPGQPYFASAMHRTGKRTSFDLLGGLEKYLGSAKNQIYHIDDIQTLRAVRNYIAEMYGQASGLENLSELSDEEAQQRIEDVYGSHLSTFAKFLNEEANVLAGKTALIDRGLEGIIGRRGITFLNALNRQVGSNMVGYNISSSLTNFLAPVQAFAKSNKFDFVKGMAQTAANKVGSIFGHGDGFAEVSPVMIRRKGAEAFYRTPWQKLSDPGYVLMGAVDEVSTELIARAKYNELTRKGMDSQQAHYETDKWVSRLMGDRSLGQQPQLYNSKMLGLVTKFQLEVRNQLDSQFYDTIQEAKASTEEIQNGLLRNAKKAAKITSTFVQLAVLQHLFGKAFESVAGYNPAFDIISAIIKAFGWDDDEEDEDTVLDNIEEGFFELMGDMPYVSTLTGGRIPIESALPIEELYKGEDKYGNEKSRWKTLGEAAPYYLLPGGYGQIKKTMQGLDMFEEDLPIAGSYTDSGNLRFPVEDTTQNRVQAALFGQWASKNARDYFDNEWKPLNEKQTQEFIDSDMPIRDYREYRDGLSDLPTLAEKADYIDSLDLPISTKNLLINNIADRKDPIDMASYDEFDSFEEFDYAQKNPEKYDFLTEYGISYSQYKSFGDDAKEEIDNAYSWVKNNPEKVTFSKAVTDNVLEYRQYTSALNAIRADKDSSGKSISGSAKAKKVEYINSLDLDYGAKLVLFKNEYNADDTYNGEIIEYIISRDDFSYEDKVAILKELGFEVSSDGTVTW